MTQPTLPKLWRLHEAVTRRAVAKKTRCVRGDRARVVMPAPYCPGSTARPAAPSHTKLPLKPPADFPSISEHHIRRRYLVNCERETAIQRMFWTDLPLPSAARPRRVSVVECELKRTGSQQHEQLTKISNRRELNQAREQIVEGPFTRHIVSTALDRTAPLPIIDAWEVISPSPALPNRDAATRSIWLSKTGYNSLVQDRRHAPQVRRVACFRSRLGFTLIELLVVVAILGALVVVVVPNASRSIDLADSKAAAENVESMVRQMRSLAIAQHGGVGFELAVTRADSAAADFITECEQEVHSVSLGTTGSGNLTASTEQLSSGLIIDRRSLHEGWDSLIKDFLAAADGTTRYNSAVIQFNGLGPRYDLRRSSVGGTATWYLYRRLPTDLWPRVQNTAGTPVRDEFCTLWLPPDRTNRLVQIARNHSIDLIWSGYGSPHEYDASSLANRLIPVSPSNNPPATVGSVAITFDSVGKVSSIWKPNVSGNGYTTVNPHGVIVLLVGRRDRCGQPFNAAVSSNDPNDSIGANWQYPGSYWIAIEASSGLVSVAETVPYQTSALLSQKLVRHRLSGALQ